MKLFGKAGGTLISVGIIISVIGAGNGFLMAGSRVVYALALDKALPMSGWLAELNDNQVPANSILFVGVLAAVYSFTGQFDLLTDLGVFSCWIFYTITFMAVIVLRKKQPERERPCKVPLYPVIPVLAVLSGLFVIVSQFCLSGMSATLMSLFSLMITLAGWPVYIIVKNRSY